jgi:hypothetical protein
MMNKKLPAEAANSSDGSADEDSINEQPSNEKTLSMRQL